MKKVVMVNPTARDITMHQQTNIWKEFSTVDFQTQWSELK